MRWVSTKTLKMGLVGLLVKLIALASLAATNASTTVKSPLVQNPDVLSKLSGANKPWVQLGRHLFFDTNLSRPKGQSCASCHNPATAFSEARANFPISPGAVKNRFGNRNAPTLMYASLIPPLSEKIEEGESVKFGGLFLDSRANTLNEQAAGPFLNPVEMNNPSKKSIVKAVLDSSYAKDYLKLCPKAKANTEKGFACITKALSLFESSKAFAPFSSKYDYYLKGIVQLSEAEKRGLVLFEAEDKGNCAACHPSQIGTNGTHPLFTDFTHDNLGVPPHPDNPFFSQVSFNPEGKNYRDPGLATTTHDPADRGKFRVPTLRNIALTAPYMHNGYFDSLRRVIEFYNSRDHLPKCSEKLFSDIQAQLNSCWPAPEVAATVNQEELGNLKLSEKEMDDLLAFLKTLTDGFEPTSTIEKRYSGVHKTPLRLIKNNPSKKLSR